MVFFKFFGLFSIIPATLLLTVSFFVLFAMKKSDQNGLKSFGMVIAVLLWLSAALVFSIGIFVTASGGPMGMMRHGMMMKGGMMKNMPCPMMEEGKKGSMQEQMQKMMKK